MDIQHAGKRDNCGEKAQFKTYFDEVEQKGKEEETEDRNNNNNQTSKNDIEHKRHTKAKSNKKIKYEEYLCIGID